MPRAHQASNDQPTTLKTAPASADSQRRIAGIYLGIGLIWIWLTDLLLYWSGTQTTSGLVVSASKGTLFVCLSAPFVYWLVRRGYHAIDRTNALLRAITDGTTDAVFVKDRDGKYLLFNRAAAGFVGKPISAVLGRDDRDLFDPQSARFAMERDRNVMAAGQAQTHEEELTAAGETRVYLATKAPYRDESGNVIGLIGVSRDITERKAAEVVVRDREAFARAVLDSVAAHIAVLDAEGMIVAVNESWRTFATTNSKPDGPAPRTGIGTNYLRVCDESAGDGCTEAATAAAGIRQVLAGTKDRFAFEYPCDSPDEQRWFEMSVTRFAGRPGVVVAHTNITVRKLAEDETRTSREMLRLVLDNIPQGVFWKDRDSRFLGCNLVVARSMGLATPDAIAGRSHADLPSITPDQIEQFVQKDREVMDAGMPKHHILETMTLADGRTIWLDTNKVPMRDADGRVIGVLGTWEDITERRRAEEELREQRDRLARIADTAPGVIFSCRIRPNGETTFPYVSPRITDIYGASPEDLAVDGAAILGSVHPDDAGRFRASIERSARELTVWRETYQVNLPGEKVCWIEGNATPIREPDGSTVWHGFLMEITDRKRDEQLLRYQHALLTSQAEASPDGILVVDPDNRIRSFNRRFRELWGIPEELVAAGDDMPVLAMARSRTADPDGFAARVAAIYADPEMQSHDEVALADGRTLDRYSGPIRGDGGERLGRVWFFRDITERKTAEEARSLLVAIVQSADEAIVSADPDGVIRSWNPAAERLFGHSPAEAIGHSNFELVVPPDRLAESRERVERVVRGEHLQPLETVRLRKGSDPVHVSVSVSAVHVEGRVVGLSAIYTNITERKRVEADRNRFVALADSSQEFIGICDKDFKPFYVNAAGLRLVGFENLEAACRVKVQDFFFTEDQEYISAEFFSRVQRDGNANVEIRFRHFQTGDAIWMDYNVFTIRDPAGAVIGWATVSRNIHARKLAEQAFLERKRLLNIVTESARVGLVVVNHHYEYLFANEAYADIFGLGSVEIIGSRVPDLLAAGWSQIQPKLDRALAGERVEYELTLPALSEADGPRTFRVMYEPHTEDDEKPTVVVVVMDITEQKRAEDSIRESENRYRSLVDILPAAVFINSGGKISFCNPACVRLFGATDSVQILGKSPFDLFHPDFHDVVRRRIDEISVTGRAVPGIEVRVRRLDGRTAPVHSVATPIVSAGSMAILVALTDLTERERSMDLLRSVLGSVNDAILTIDERGAVQSANPATERSFGYSEPELIGKNVKVLMPEPYQNEHDGYIANYLRTGVKKIIGIGREVEGRRKDGTTFPLELTVTEFRLDERRHFTGVVRDITARKQLEAQFQQAQKMEAVGRLAGGVAHDFNNLLTVINGYSDMVLDALPSHDPQREFISAIRESGDRAARLTHQLLAFSRKAIIEPKILDLNELIAESAKLLRRLIGEDIVLVVVPDQVPVRIKADPGQIEQVVMNLVVNGRDAMPTGGRLTIETRIIDIGDDDLLMYPGVNPGRYARISVADSGHGMTKEVKNKIFEPFFTTKGLGKGTGLGLAVVHGVVEQCGGHIAVESTVGVGTTFTLLFPIAKETKVGPVSVTAQIAAQGTETLLLVEDEDAVRTIARIALTMQGFTVLEAESGTEAIRLAEDHSGPIHLLITDVVMPEIGGRQLAEAVRKCRSDVKVLYMSGYTDDAVVHHGVETTDAFVQKPFTPLGLARKVRAVLDGTA
jgi:PAS domain S-box-containing protein